MKEFCGWSLRRIYRLKCYLWDYKKAGVCEGKEPSKRRLSKRDDPFSDNFVDVTRRALPFLILECPKGENQTFPLLCKSWHQFHIIDYTGHQKQNPFLTVWSQQNDQGFFDLAGPARSFIFRSFPKGRESKHFVCAAAGPSWKWFHSSSSHQYCTGAAAPAKSEECFISRFPVQLSQPLRATSCSLAVNMWTSTTYSSQTVSTADSAWVEYFCCFFLYWTSQPPLFKIRDLVSSGSWVNSKLAVTPVPIWCAEFKRREKEIKEALSSFRLSSHPALAFGGPSMRSCYR